MLRITSILNQSTHHWENKFYQIYNIKLYSPKEKLLAEDSYSAVKLWTVSRGDRGRNDQVPRVTNEETISTDKGKDGEGNGRRRKEKKRKETGRRRVGGEKGERGERTLGFSK